jgi:hypothetical protein
MDVDKPSQLELLREDLAQQQRKELAKTKSAERRSPRKTTKSKPAAKTTRKSSSEAKKAAPVPARTKLKAEK